MDALAFLCIHRFNVDVLSPIGLGHVVDQFITAPLRSAWQELSADMCPSERMTFNSDEPEFNDFTFYRWSLAWVEYKTISRFRNAIDPLYFDSTAKDHITNARGIEFSKVYFASVKTLEFIVTPPTSLQINLQAYDNNSAGAFLRTLAFVHLLRSQIRCSITADQLLSLLNWTRDIARVATVEDLKDFFGPAQEDCLTAYLANALIADCSNRDMDKHRLRRALQDLVIQRFNRDIIEFAHFLAKNSKHVANHLFETCTEAFLVQLFLLLTTPEMVFETRARLLDWYAEVFDEPSAKERAKTLRLDQRLRMVRGEIDDTRIYVDSIEVYSMARR